MPRPRLTQPGRLRQIVRHQPVETCAACRQPWPCANERARVEGQRRAREAVARATEAALLIKTAPTGGQP